MNHITKNNLSQKVRTPIESNESVINRKQTKFNVNQRKGIT